MRYAVVDQSDSVHQGRMIILGIGVTYVILWILEFLAYPVLLVPGFLYDDTGRTLFNFVGLMIQLGIIGSFSLLLWAGAGWARYVLGSFLLVVGLFNVVLSMFLDAEGGVQLVVGAVALVSAAALVISLGVGKYAERSKAKRHSMAEPGPDSRGSVRARHGIGWLRSAQDMDAGPDRSSGGGFCLECPAGFRPVA
jgi:hypothetical protein